MKKNPTCWSNYLVWGEDINTGKFNKLMGKNKTKYGPLLLGKLPKEQKKYMK